MNCYEHTLITKGDLSDNDVKKILEKYSNIISENSGKIVKTEEWGLRNLSYEIKKNKKGFYFHLKLEGIGKTIEEALKKINPEKLLELNYWPEALDCLFRLDADKGFLSFPQQI